MRLMVACRAIDAMAGGVERQALALANEMSKRGHEVCLFTLDAKNACAFYTIDSEVSWYKLGILNPKKRASWTVRFQRMRRVRQIMREFKPDACLAFQDGMFIALRAYTVGMGVPIVAAERETPERYLYVKYRMPFKRVLFFFRFAAHITVQCPSYLALYPQHLRFKMTVIPNAIKVASAHAYPKKEPSKIKTILCVGRLTYQKNHETLLNAFSKIHTKYPEWRVVCVGEGELKQHLMRQVQRLQIEKRVEFIPPTQDIAAYYVKADFLCIPSYWEGFPNVLGEALAHGLPAVGYRGCGGVCDLIQEGVNGFLADGNGNVETLTDALIRMIELKEQRAVFSAAAVESMKQYDDSIVYDQWDQFLKGVACK